MQASEKAKQVPEQPGCYLFKDEKGTVIYVGKAKNLRKRVMQYFRKSSRKEEKGLVLSNKIRDIEFRTTETEREALIREYLLIKEYEPWFNVQHKGERRHTYFIKIQKNKAYPSITITDEKPDNTGVFFGCFRTRNGAEEILFLMNRVWKLPVCEKEFEQKQRTCVHNQTGHCIGPCARRIESAAYLYLLEDICRFFQGKHQKYLREKEREMEAYVEQLEFEKAAECRNALETIEYLKRRCRYVDRLSDKADTVIFVRAFGEMECSVFFSRKGAVLYRQELKAGDTAAINEFVEKIRNGAKPDVSDVRMFSCIREISADKKIVRLTHSTPIETRIYEAWCEFTDSRHAVRE